MHAQGFGFAGVIAAETIRKLAPLDAITLIGDEPEPSYSRMAIPYLLMVPGLVLCTVIGGVQTLQHLGLMAKENV